MLKIILVLFFSIWAIFSVILQFPKYREAKFKEYDIFSLIPYWTFFAPNPNISDYRFFYVLFDNHGNKGDFIEVNYFYAKQWFSVLWHPYKRVNKFYFDTVQSLVLLFKEVDNERISTTLPYYILLNYLKEVNQGNDNFSEIQFIIIETYGIITDKEPKMIFSSKVHSI